MIAQKLSTLRAGGVTAENNVAQYVERIQRLNPNLNAYIEFNPEYAFEQARRIDRKLQEGNGGKLAGLVLGIKSNINVEGFRATCASKTLENYVAPYDAEVIRRIKEADGIIIGMTNMDEFACGSSGEQSFFGPTKNPSAPGYITGGSSAGSAAAVAAGMCDLALGSDTGGSIRNPASHCGVVGIKPTYGLVPREGLIDLAMSLDQIGPFSRDVEGAELLLDVIHGYNPRECTTVQTEIEKPKDVKGLRIGVSQKFEDVTEPRINSVINSSLDKFVAETGAQVVSVDLPFVEKALMSYYPIVYVEFFSATRKFDGVRYGHKIEDVCLDEVRRRIEIGRHISQQEVIGKYYKKALQVRGIIRDAYTEAFQRCDVIVSPTVPKLPHKIGEDISVLDMYGYDLLTIPPNLAGIAAGVVPAGKVDGIPVGLQVQAPRLGEATMFRAMGVFESLNRGYNG